MKKRTKTSIIIISTMILLLAFYEIMIIINKRNEAEEAMLKQQQETSKLIENILMKMINSESINISNHIIQDEIVIPEMKIMDAPIDYSKISRNYVIEVGVTNISEEMSKKYDEMPEATKRRFAKLIQLNNVEELEYSIFYHQDINCNPPIFPSDNDLIRKNIIINKLHPGQRLDYSDGNSWEFLCLHKLKLDLKSMINRIDIRNKSYDICEPIYPINMEEHIGPPYTQIGNIDSVIFYSKEKTVKQLKDSVKKIGLKTRSFIVNFEPPRKDGWYKLRFASRTNRIIGVNSKFNKGQLTDDETVMVGILELKVKDIRIILNQIKSKYNKINWPIIEFTKEGSVSSENIIKFEDSLRMIVNNVSTTNNNDEIYSKIKLYEFLIRLITPDALGYYPQCFGYIDFNVRVVIK